MQSRLRLSGLFMSQIGSTFIASGLNYCECHESQNKFTHGPCLDPMICTNPWSPLGIKPILTVMLQQPLILMCWSRFHGHGPRARSPGIMISLSRAAQWETTPEPGTEPCYGGVVQYAVSGSVMLGGNLGNWIKTEPDLYIGGLCHHNWVLQVHNVCNLHTKYIRKYCHTIY